MNPKDRNRLYMCIIYFGLVSIHNVSEMDLIKFHIKMYVSIKVYEFPEKYKIIFEVIGFSRRLLFYNSFSSNMNYS